MAERRQPALSLSIDIRKALPSRLSGLHRLKLFYTQSLPILHICFINLRFNQDDRNRKA
jgi:hypothetical protein